MTAAEYAEMMLTGYMRLNETWAAAERNLEALHPSLPCWVAVGPSRKKFTDAVVSAPRGRLGWCRYADRWRICFATEDAGPEDHKALTECSLAQRIALVEFFPLLRCEVVRVSRTDLRTTQAAVERLRSMLDELLDPKEGDER